MRRITKYIVYVDKVIMDKPVELADAVFAHLIKKGLDIAKRKVFLAKVMKVGYSPELQLDVINQWVQVRDVTTFPYRKEQELSKTGIDVVEAAAALRTVMGAMTKTDPLGDPEVITEGDVDISGEEQDADTEAEGSVPVDDGADGESEQESASE